VLLGQRDARGSFVSISRVTLGPVSMSHADAPRRGSGVTGAQGKTPRRGGSPKTSRPPANGTCIAALSFEPRLLPDNGLLCTVEKQADTVGHSLSMPHRCCHCAKFSTLLGLQRRPMGSMICGTLGLTNSIRALCVHTSRVAYNDGVVRRGKRGREEVMHEDAVQHRCGGTGAVE
jgi:hypothetical protein